MRVHANLHGVEATDIRYVEAEGTRWIELGTVNLFIDDTAQMDTLIASATEALASIQSEEGPHARR